MRDLVGHDKSPSAFLVYLHIWSQTEGRGVESAALSHQRMAESTGLSKSPKRHPHPGPPQTNPRHQTDRNQHPRVPGPKTVAQKSVIPFAAPAC